METRHRPGEVPISAQPAYFWASDGYKALSENSRTSSAIERGPIPVNLVNLRTLEKASGEKSLEEHAADA